MPNSTNSLVCQRCGRGFLMTTAHRDFLVRRGIRVKVPMQCMACFLRDGPLIKERGRIKWFNSRKRYGFISAEGGQEFFLHQHQVLEDEVSELRKGQAVRFHVYQSLKGPEAWNVELAEE